MARYDRLLACLSWAKKKYPGARLIVSEQGIAPSVSTVALKFGDYFFSSSAGPFNFSAAVNTVLPSVSTDVVVLNSADSVIDDTTMLSMVDLAGGSYAAYSHTEEVWVRPEAMYDISAGNIVCNSVSDEHVIRRLRVLPGICHIIAFNTASLKHVRGLNTRFTGNSSQDVEIIFRMQAVFGGSIPSASGTILHVDHPREFQDDIPDFDKFIPLYAEVLLPNALCKKDLLAYMGISSDMGQFILESFPGSLLQSMLPHAIEFSKQQRLSFLRRSGQGA